MFRWHQLPPRASCGQRRPKAGTGILKTRHLSPCEGRLRLGDPRGTLEWGETIRELIPRELPEEAGVRVRSIGRLVGVYSRPDRDVRFHGVTIVVTCEVDLPHQPPMNLLEIREVGLFADADVPLELGVGTGDMLEAARRGAVDPVIE